MKKHKGFTLPLAPNGESALVVPPPWHFGGDLIEVLYRTDMKIFKEFLPSPFTPVGEEAIVSVTMVDMVAATSAEQCIITPERTQYKECLIKLYASFQGNKVWYVPATWVTSDFSLLRGFIMGFGKKIGTIYTTRFHPLMPIVKEVQVGDKRKGVCESFCGLHASIELELTESVSALKEYTGIPICVTRHFPDVEHPEKVLLHDVSRLEVSNYQRKDIWLAEGKVTIAENPLEPLTALQPRGIVAARTFSEGFTLTGITKLYEYKYGKK